MRKTKKENKGREQTERRWIGGSYSGDHEKYDLVGCNAV
jgi:hypothetical protein